MYAAPPASTRPLTVAGFRHPHSLFLKWRLTPAPLRAESGSKGEKTDGGPKKRFTAAIIYDNLRKKMQKPKFTPVVRHNKI
jgi:hypothetical protein